MVGCVDGLTRRIAVALGLAPLLLSSATGCSGRSLDDPDDIAEGDGDDGDGSTGVEATGTSSPSGSGETGVGSSSDDGTTPACFPSDQWLEWEFTLPVDAQGLCPCDQECRATALSQWNQENCCDSCEYEFGEVKCSEVSDGNVCHYIVTMAEAGCGKGRPLFIDDQARTAPATARDDWAQPGLEPWVRGLDVRTRRALADHWLHAALAEHASVASFARFVLDLGAMGAPPALLTDATTAIQDEVRHAQIAFALAGAYAGEAVGPGPLPLHGLVAGADSEAIVRAAVREGCVEETLAAAEAELAAHRATDPAVRHALTAIAEDEARHAVLAWRFVDWALSRDASLATAVLDELQRATVAIEEAQASDDRPDDAWPADLPTEIASGHGVVPLELRQRLRAECMEHTVRLCGTAMVRAHSARCSPSLA
ncbi:MAG: ferritin-like domain-containing protein [Deltaproteobacteria bacterium]|nr:ferritin-like domain-containing protein [Deltaproteobacteria bacterium]